MTLAELNRHLELVKRLDENTEYIERLRNTYGVQSPVITDMPHGSGGVDRISVIASEVADLEAKNKYLANEVKISEKNIKKFTASIDDTLTRLIFNLRFIGGFEWKEVARLTGGGNTSDSVRKLCYRYLRVNDDGWNA